MLPGVGSGVGVRPVGGIGTPGAAEVAGAGSPYRGPLPAEIADHAPPPSDRGLTGEEARSECPRVLVVEPCKAHANALILVLQRAGFTVEHSEAGLYLWATRGEPCRDTVAWFAERGILVAPGEFYGARGARHVRIALTATDERIAAAVARLA